MENILNDRRHRCMDCGEPSCPTRERGRKRLNEYPDKTLDEIMKAIPVIDDPEFLVVTQFE